MKNIYCGYVTVRQVNDMNVPVTLQHATMNNYCQQNGGIYKLAQTELVIKNSSFVLFSLINKIKKRGKIIMSSMFMLPGNKEKRLLVYKKINQKKIEIHCAFENFCIKDKKSSAAAEDMFALNNSIKNNNFFQVKELSKFKFLS